MFQAVPAGVEEIKIVKYFSYFFPIFWIERNFISINL